MAGRRDSQQFECSPQSWSPQAYLAALCRRRLRPHLTRWYVGLAGYLPRQQVIRIPTSWSPYLFNCDPTRRPMPQKREEPPRALLGTTGMQSCLEEATARSARRWSTDAWTAHGRLMACLSAPAIRQRSQEPATDPCRSSRAAWGYSNPLCQDRTRSTAPGRTYGRPTGPALPKWCPRSRGRYLGSSNLA